MLWFKAVFTGSNTGFLIWMGAAVAIANIGWRVVINNFAVAVVGMDGEAIGISQSLREIPGLLAFTVLFWLMFIKEQTMAVLSLSLLGMGVAITGILPSVYGFYFTTILMSTGFHYLESLSSSLATQFYSQAEFNDQLGQLRSADSFFGLLAFLVIMAMLNWFDASFKVVFMVCGGMAILISIYLFTFQQIATTSPHQHHRPVLRKKYSLYYALVFLAGARRQIFVVFAGFLLVEKFGFRVSDMAILFFSAHLATVFVAPSIGSLVTWLGAKKTLGLEYVILTGIFILYARIDSPAMASILYILDGLAFSLSIALKSYFKEIAAADDITATTSVAFTINHIAAVCLPFMLGSIWIIDYRLVFYIGAAFAVASIVACLFIREGENRSVGKIAPGS